MAMGGAGVSEANGVPLMAERLGARSGGEMPGQVGHDGEISPLATLGRNDNKTGARMTINCYICNGIGRRMT